MLGFDGKVPVGDAFTGAQRSWDFMRPLLSALIVGACAGMIEQAEVLLRSETRWTPRARAACTAALADLRRKHLSARLLAQRAAWRYDQGIAMSKDAKAYAATVAMETAETITRLAGIAAMHEDWLFEKWYRDAKAFDILEGTGDMQRLLIAKLHSASNCGSLPQRLAAARNELHEKALATATAEA
jgi:acyl-CoA dehydrogenase